MSTLRVDKLNSLDGLSDFDIKGVELTQESYISKGVYGPGLLIDNYQSKVVFDGLDYRPKTTEVLPFTTTSWATDEAKFIPTGDGLLRLALSNGTGNLIDASAIPIRRYPTSQDSDVERFIKRNSSASVFDYMSEVEILDVYTLSPVLDHTNAFNTALANNTTVLVPPFFYNTSTIQMNKFGQGLVAIETSGGQAYGGGAVLKSTSGSLDMCVVTKPTCLIQGLVFFGKSSDVEKGEDVTQTAVRMIGDVQKDLDATVRNCTFIYVRSGVVANGTNILFDSVSFSNLKYGFETVTTGGWENRGFVFSDTCRYHSIGKTGSLSAAIKLWPAHNIRDVQICGGLCDDTTTFVSGFASGLQISQVQSVRSRNTGIVLDATGHGQPASMRAAGVSGFKYYATDATNTSVANSAVTATGLMRLTLDDVTSCGTGGHGIESSVTGAVLRNCHASDAGQLTTNTYDGILISGAGSFLSGLSSSQDAQGNTPANKARYGIHLNATCYVSSISPGLNTTSGPLNVGAGVSVYGDLPRVDAPANSITWGTSMPTSGTRRTGDIHFNSAPTVLSTAGSQYVVSGWKRLTSGTGHVLGTDWVAMRTLTGT